MPKKRKKFNNASVLSMFAMAVSIIALLVSFYEAKLLNKQYDLMSSQQKASVWPHLITNLSTIGTDQMVVSYSLENKGIGPAKISKSELKINDQVMINYDDIIRQFKAVIPVDINPELGIKLIDDVVVSAGEKVVMLECTLPRFKDDRKILHNLNINYNICYCSIYDDCWQVKDSDAKPIEGCD